MSLEISPVFWDLIEVRRSEPTLAADELGRPVE